MQHCSTAMTALATAHSSCWLAAPQIAQQGTGIPRQIQAATAPAAAAGGACPAEGDAASARTPQRQVRQTTMAEAFAAAPAAARHGGESTATAEGLGLRESAAGQGPAVALRPAAKPRQPAAPPEKLVQRGGDVRAASVFDFLDGPEEGEEGEREAGWDTEVDADTAVTDTEDVEAREVRLFVSPDHVSFHKMPRWTCIGISGVTLIRLASGLVLVR